MLEKLIQVGRVEYQDNFTDVEQVKRSRMLETRCGEESVWWTVTVWSWYHTVTRHKDMLVWSYHDHLKNISQPCLRCDWRVSAGVVGLAHHWLDPPLPRPQLPRLHLPALLLSLQLLLRHPLLHHQHSLLLLHTQRIHSCKNRIINDDVLAMIINTFNWFYLKTKNLLLVVVYVCQSQRWPLTKSHE